MGALKGSNFLPAHLRNGLHRIANARGFTLLEVLVAIVLVGTGIAAGFTAMSGNTRMEEKMAAQDAAAILARAKLDEAMSSPDFVIAKELSEDRYAGTDFGYRLQLQQIPILTAAQQERIPSFKRQLERISIEVFWGPKEAKQSYTLSNYRIASSPRTNAPATPDQRLGRP